jgi:hypothetical protein
VVTRALQRRQPFDSRGHDGYRDVLLWENAMEYAERDHDVALVSADVRAFHQSKSDKRLSDALGTEVQRRCGRAAVTLYVDLKQLASEYLEPSQDAEIALWKLFENEDFSTAFWSRVDREIVDAPVPPSAVDLPSVTTVHDAYVTASGWEGYLPRAFVRASSADAGFRADLTVVMDATIHVTFSTADYATLASTAGTISILDVDDVAGTVAADVHGWITVDFEVVVDLEGNTLRRVRAVRVADFSESRPPEAE